MSTTVFKFKRRAYNLCGVIFLREEKNFSSFHYKIPVVDAHCDTLTALEKQSRKLGLKSDSGHVDLPRLIEGGVNLQFFAAFISPEYRDNPLARALEVFDIYFTEIQENSDLMGPVYGYSDIERLFSQGKVASLLTVEGGEALAGRLEVLRVFYHLGVRAMTLTWNHRNELADGALETGTGGGLTVFGKEVVREMNRLGMLIDVSHLAPRGFWDVLDETVKPVIASHSNCKELCEHPRNLDDQQVKAISDCGGVIGLCFYPDFVNKEQPSLEYWFKHVEHIAGIAGTDCIGIGSDFDGIDQVVSGMVDVTSMPLITEGLLKRGFSCSEVEKIMGGNFLRVLRQVI